jgi:hypothetical protein
MNKGILKKWGIAPSIKIVLPIADSNDLIETHLSIYPLRPTFINKALIYIEYNDNTISHAMIDKDILEIMYDSNNSYNLAVNILEYIDSKIYNINQYDVFNNIKKVNAYLNEVNKLLVSYSSLDCAVIPPYPNQWQPENDEDKIKDEPMKQ